MDPIEALEAATEQFDRMLAQVAADRWAAATPCPDWTVADVADHVTGGNSWAVMILDVARGAGLDDTLPPELVDELLARLEPMADTMAHSGWFGTGQEGAEPAQTPQQRLLHLAGRRP